MNWTTRQHANGKLDHLQTLDDAISHFLEHYPERHPDGHHDRVLLHVKSAGPLTEAIVRACAGMTVEGKKFRHDQFLKSSTVENLQRRLISTRHLRSATNFDSLHDLINSLRPKGIGQLKVFDVSMRIGTWLKIDPEESDFVYLHRGALVGWQNLTDSRGKPYQFRSAAYPPPCSRCRTT